VQTLLNMKFIFPSLILLSATVISCSTDVKEGNDKDNNIDTPIEIDSNVVKENPHELLQEAYQLFKEGNDEGSIEIANKVLEIGRETNNDTLIGGALSSMCRNAQRTLDTTRLSELSIELAALAESSGDQKWMMKRAHMNAEMWRLVGNMERAEAFYNESMSISESIGAMGMFTIDHFNKSFVSTATGDFEEAYRLLKKYYALRMEADPKSEDAYGLIALAYLLEQQGEYEYAHEVATVTRRLFKEQNIFPEPPDEKPLIAVEEKVILSLEAEVLADIVIASKSETVSSLVAKYLN